MSLKSTVALFHAKTQKDQTRILNEIYNCPFCGRSWPQAINVKTSFYKYFSLRQFDKKRARVFEIRSGQVDMCVNEVVGVSGSNDEYAIVGFLPNHLWIKFSREVIMFFLQHCQVFK